MLTNHLQGRRYWRQLGKYGRHAVAQQHYDRMYWSSCAHTTGETMVQQRRGMFVIDHKTA